MIDGDALAELLPAHLRRQRWFGSRSGLSGEVRIESMDRINIQGAAPGDGTSMFRAVVVVEGGRYHLILGLRSQEWGPDQVGKTAAVGLVPTTDGPRFCYDALVDPELSRALLRTIDPRLAAGQVRAVLAEQSNTSLVGDEEFIFKLFRRLVGDNPDVELTRALHEAGFGAVPEPRAVWRAGTDDLGLAQRFLAGGVEGWALALASLRDLLDSPPEVDAAHAGADFGPEAARLGELTAELHRILASALGTSAGDAGAWAAAFADRARAVNHNGVDDEVVATVVGGLAGVDDAGVAIRVHGDFHLGQLLHADEGWYVLDFEGEPSRPIDERRAPTSPLRDVAGLLRSLHYASRVAAAEQERANGNERVLSWEQRNRAAFLRAYWDGMSGSGLLPDDDATRSRILAAFELDKAVYEVGYEMAYRPDWVEIPLEAIQRLGAGRRR